MVVVTGRTTLTPPVPVSSPIKAEQQYYIMKDLNPQMAADPLRRLSKRLVGRLFDEGACDGGVGVACE